MSDPNPEPRGTTARKGHGSRYLFLFLLGLVMGAVGVVMVLRAWDARKDHFPESLMHVQGWHMAARQSGRAEPLRGYRHAAAPEGPADDVGRSGTCVPRSRRRPALQRRGQQVARHP